MQGGIENDYTNYTDYCYFVYKFSWRNCGRLCSIQEVLMKTLIVFFVVIMVVFLFSGVVGRQPRR